MTVRFKFRSSVNFDSVDIGGRPSISVRDLRANIIQQKNLTICHDFDLVISHADSGEAFEDEEFQVPDGSSVIIKRVPAGISAAPPVTPYMNNIEKTVTKHSNFINNTVGSFPTANMDTENFDDFGIDLYPAPEASISDFFPDSDELNCISNKKADIVVQRLSEPTIAKCQNMEPSDLSEASKGCGIEGDKFQRKTELMKMHLEVEKSTPALANTDLPAELRCSLCNSIFKDAVMIPCCQHSFCDKCIRLVLIEKKRCPKCSSIKSGINDLLPNVSLRQAIDHFLESQVLMSGSDKTVPKYAPDRESGIQVRDVSCAMSTVRGEPHSPHSPTATGKGSNQVTPDSVFESRSRNNQLAAGTGSSLIRLEVNKCVKSATFLHKIKLAGDENDKALKSGCGPTFPQEEANKRRKGLWGNAADGSGNFIGTSKHKRGDRTCYMCGSPDHLVRDCPAASSPYPIYPTGETMYRGSVSAYGMPCWQGVRPPFGSLYANPGMLPFDPSMVPISPFGVSPYMPHMYGNLPLQCGFVRMGGMMPSFTAGAERPVTRAEYMELHDNEQRHRVLSEHPRREDASDHNDSRDGHGYDGAQRKLHDHKSHLDREITRSYSGDGDSRRSRKKHCADKHPDSATHQRSSYTSDQEFHSVGRDHGKASHFSASSGDYRSHYLKRSNREREAQDVSDSSNHRSRERVKHHRSSKQHSQKSHYQSRKDSDDHKRIDTDIKRHSQKHHSHLGAGLEPSSSGDRRRQRREKDSSHSSGHKVKTVDDDQLPHDRWEMVDGLDGDRHKDHHYYHKCKRTH